MSSSMCMPLMAADVVAAAAAAAEVAAMLMVVLPISILNDTMELFFVQIRE